MGNSSSSKTQDDTVDFGFLTPHGVYTGPRDWNQQIVGQNIIDRRLAPFYRPLEDYEEGWDDVRILAARKFPEGTEGEGATDHHHHRGATSASSRPPTPPSSKSSKFKGGKETVPRITEAQVYRGATECPICFMYYPPNINKTRCCYQTLCTECFVQIKRIEPTPTHLVSEPACCPYCMQEKFGVTYAPPPWRTGLGSDTPLHLQRPILTASASSEQSSSGRRKSISADSPEVVTTDQIRPDWAEKLAAVKAAVARRANRRIIMRQVGDRLIPVGVTSSRTQLPEGVTTVEDIEELMLMEAMRLSLLEHQNSQPSGGSSGTPASAPSTAIPTVTTSSLQPVAPPAPSVSSSVPNPSTLSALPSQTPHRRTESGSLAASLANSGNAIAIAMGLPSPPPGASSSNTASTSQPPEAPSHISRASTSSSNSNHGSGLSALSGLRGRFGRSKEGGSNGSTSNQHRRTESNPPPMTAAIALGAHSTATAFLQTPEGPGGVQSARSAPVTPMITETILPSAAHTEYLAHSDVAPQTPTPVLVQSGDAEGSSPSKHDPSVGESDLGRSTSETVTQPAVASG